MMDRDVELRESRVDKRKCEVKREVNIAAKVQIEETENVERERRSKRKEARPIVREKDSTEL